MPPKRKNFGAEVLIPRRIIISTTNRSIRDPFKHFGTLPPSRGVADYIALEGIEASKVWLSFDDESIEEIIEEYEVMGNEGSSEAEYASFAMEVFFKRQRRFAQVPSDRKWRTRRAQQLFVPPNERLSWLAPPPFMADSQEFKFDIRPDCSYWLSVAGFNRRYRGELAGAVYVHKRVITCPYFTIEFKKQNQSVEQAKVQAATAASVALYNRFLLKQRALEITETPWTDFDKNQMRHYIITFVGEEFNIWILEADFGEDNDSWNGCHMSALWQGSCSSDSVVIQLGRWINEIHRWGLSQHATSCQQDVKNILGNDGMDVSLHDL